ncbi:hypothetical protein [Streptomyces hundungensis]|uniref:hypothetical protein n=1 Tax=Streptomyces hundungensis TaxID=1077946 RepID=UPI000EA97221|nr:hypothetical protein [Streptomyces hundungensis]
MSDSTPPDAAEPEVGGPVPLDVPRAPTGDAAVDALVERLGDVDHLGTDGHLEVYEDVHRGLRDSLSALDARPGHPPSPGAAPGTSGPARPLAERRP